MLPYEGDGEESVSITPFLSQMEPAERWVQETDWIKPENVTSDMWLRTGSSFAPESGRLVPDTAAQPQAPPPTRDRPLHVAGAGAVEHTLSEDKPAWEKRGRGRAEHAQSLSQTCHGRSAGRWASDRFADH